MPCDCVNGVVCWCGSEVVCLSLPQPDAKGQINSLSTVLSQEVDRFNKLLKVIKVFLELVHV